MERKIAFWILATLVICWSPVIMAQQAEERCIDTDGPLQIEQRRDLLLPGKTSGYVTVREENRRRRNYVTGRLDYCREDGKLVEGTCSAGSNYIQEQIADCGRRWPGYVCQNGRCTAPQEEVTLNRCQELQSNTHYVITQHTFAGQVSERRCFPIINRRAITIECRGNGSIYSVDGRTAFWIEDSNFVNIVNCLIVNFPMGFWITRNSANIRILGNTLLNNEIENLQAVNITNSSVLLSGNEQQDYHDTWSVGVSINGSTTTNLYNNTFCGRDRYMSLRCWQSIVRGSGNRLGEISESCNQNISDLSFQPCGPSR